MRSYECPICAGPKLTIEDECASCRAPIAYTKTSRIECEGEIKGNAEYIAGDTKPAEATVPLLWHAQKMTELIDKCAQAIAERDSLRAEVERLRAALERIDTDLGGGVGLAAHECHRIARKALEGVK